MAILNKQQMNDRVDVFLQELNVTDKTVEPKVGYFDYDEGEETYKYEMEEVVDLPNFDIIFNLIVEQKGTMTEGDTGCVPCLPPEFNMTSEEIMIEDLKIYDTEHGVYLDPERELYLEIFNKVKTLVIT